MSYSALDTAMLQVGKSNRKELWDKVHGNLEDHEARLNLLSVGSGQVVLFNEEYLNISSALTLTGIATFEAFENIQITKARIQIFTKDGVSSGIIEVDLKKSATLGGVYASIFTTKPALNYSAVSDYAYDDGVLNAGQAVAKNSIVRLDITSVPAGKVIKKIRILVYGVLS